MEGGGNTVVNHFIMSYQLNFFLSSRQGKGEAGKGG